MVLALFAFLSLVEGWTWDEGHFGRCGHQNKLKDFNFEFLNQSFYQVARTKQAPFAVGDCNRSNNTRLDQNTYKLNLYFQISGQHASSSLDLIFASQPGRFGSFVAKFGEQIFHANIILSDFQTYFLVYICDSEKENRRDYFEVISTSPNFDYLPYLQLGYDRGFTFDDFYFPIHDVGFCI